MNRQGWWIAVLAMGLAGLACAWDASAQVYTHSRHAAKDADRATAKTLEQLRQRFDAAEFEAMMELGDGSIRGVMGLTGIGEGSFGLFKRSTAVADREIVHLLPMTRYVEAWYEAVGKDVNGATLKYLEADALKYAGVARTDQQGNFAFDGLKPGRYLLFSEFPVAFRTTVGVVDTGERTFTYGYGRGSIKPVYRGVEGVATAMRMVDRIVEVEPGQVTIYKPERKR